MLTGRQRGVTLIELAIGLAIVGILVAAGLPAFTKFLHNQRIKNAGETTLNGITLARAEAVRRNANVRFQFVSDLTSSCTLSSTSLAWVVSTADPTSGCDGAPSESGPILQVKSALEGTGGVVTLATTGGSAIVFNALGRVATAGITQIDLRNPTGGTCEHEDSTNGEMRCLRIIVSTGGQAKLCDPKLDTAGTDPRRCV